jgi:hypothetical protein
MQLTLQYKVTPEGIENWRRWMEHELENHPMGLADGVAWEKEYPATCAPPRALEAPMPNEKNRANLQRLADIISDAHFDVCQQICAASTALMTLDGRIAKAPPGVHTSVIFEHSAERALDKAIKLAEAQAARMNRTVAELKEIRENYQKVS